MNEPPSQGAPKPGLTPRIKLAPRRAGPVEQLPEQQISKIHGPDNSPDSIRRKLLQTFGNVVAMLVDVPRYRNHSIGDLQFLILEALVRDRVLLMSHATSAIGAEPEVAAIAIWASVSEGVSAKISEQIKAGVFPIRLLPDDRTSGNVNWLLDIVTRSPDVVKQVVASFGRVTKSDKLNLHPSVSAMLDGETLKKLGAKPIAAQQSPAT